MTSGLGVVPAGLVVVADGSAVGFFAPSSASASALSLAFKSSFSWSSSSEPNFKYCFLVKSPPSR